MTSLATWAGGSLLLVGVVSSGFWLVGVVTDEEPAGVTTGVENAETGDGEPAGSRDEDGQSTDPANASDTTGDASGDDEAGDAGTDGGAGDAAGPELTGEAPDDSSDAPGAPDGADEPGEPGPEEDGGAAADDEAGEPDRIDPASVALQVLDGHQADGGAAADRVADELGELGYRVVATNPALRYEATTVLWTPGFEAEARQVAEDLGATRVSEQPGNLSDSVAVHVVVGTDRAAE